MGARQFDYRVADYARQARELREAAGQIEAHLRETRPQPAPPPRTPEDEYLELFEREFRAAIASDFND